MNINRESMSKCGFSPPTRVFEAAGAGACVITDPWSGIEEFFQPGREILVASSAEEVVRHLRKISREDSLSIGAAIHRRPPPPLNYTFRARQVDQLSPQSYP